MKAKICSISPETSRVKLYRLVAAESNELPPYTPGAHISVKIDSHGPGSRTITRSYSICNSPAERDCYLIAVQREDNGNGGSRYIHENWKVGDIIEFDGPRNYFKMDQSGKENILIAGGIGITPIVCMAGAMVDSGIPFQLHYVARDEEAMALTARVLEVAGSAAKLWFDHGKPEKGIPIDSIITEWCNGKHVYVCGPSGLIKAVRETCQVKSWPEEMVHFELFYGTTQESEKSISVKLMRSGKVVDVPNDKSILDALLQAGVEVDYDCRIGECGSCAVKVLGGRPLHRDVCLTTKERESGECMCVCVSWAESPEIALDL
ncbi:PDR/VanB family oxidoreductase [Burkholderia multivorans]|uniref:PDR/VanB family oxidoreductase n=1 Tax=Burkholderia multivorans TaxID=87883 RepID=UPI001589647F|nr:PDR/VanB family oxidoreductase [Burkholderia multivorans]MDR8877895.1 Phthalate dioxygenase reductase [Burkholderia multivorans]MDR8883487.1 Phthalate dioxygenase reductase [Burkholderia multivorans]MDR8889903.1 Phthalate dioxygenase reductase [Burkholderia multivorans]MDR8896473.1 Phthalate dioxygenase reductase [Burkholderia multivorans]MDR8902057.1 Phthalate dioxygenase reductase [Burkholderia multivorans]